NAFFRLVMSEYAGDLDYNEDHQLVPMGSFPDSTVPAVELSFFHGDDERETIELEADLIANRIKEAMTVPCVTEKGQLRNAKPGDCVILLRSLKNRASLYEERLRQHGFSVIAEQDEDFFERKEVMWTVSLLQALNNPTDDVAMLATMLSPWCGFTADRLAMLRAEHPHLPLAVCLERAAAAGNVSAKTVHENLERFRVKSATTSVDRLLGYIYDTYGILSAVRVMKNGNQCRNNLLALQALAKECSDNGYDRLDGFLRYIKKLQEEKATVSVPAAACDSNAVRIMSIHHSKGLQFPICFVAGCANGFNKMDSTAPILLDVNLGLGLTLTDDKLQMRRSTCMRQAVATEVARSSISEELRVLYVAMTRGIDRLILLTALNNPEKNISDAVMDLDSGNVSDTQALRLDPELVLSASGYGKWLLYFALLHPSGGQLQSYANTNYGYLPAEAEHCDIRLWHARQIEPPVPLQVPQERVRCADPAMVSRLQAQLNYDDPYKPLQRMFAKRSVSQLVHDTPHVSRHETHAPRPSFLQEGGLSATERGTALHTFMQYADYPAAATDFGWELERLVAQGFMTQQQADGVDHSKAAAFFAGPLYQRMARSPRVMREHRFMSQISVTQLDPTLPEKFENERVVVQGITDCVFEEDGQLVVVDYKTDRVKEIGELADRYAEQLRLYAHMLTEDMGMPIKELILYSFHLGTSLSL
ncbi:MAG: PD-(D/E)XK nuclease family protein, partial [Clostridia bacterium]|nr:PD-(D/E)XK nuclease family protein [Clostridia bacterium]